MQALKLHAKLDIKLDIGHTADFSYFCIKLIQSNVRVMHNTTIL